MKIIDIVEGPDGPGREHDSWDKGPPEKYNYTRIETEKDLENLKKRNELRRMPPAEQDLQMPNPSRGRDVESEQRPPEPPPVHGKYIGRKKGYNKSFKGNPIYKRDDKQIIGREL